MNETLQLDELGFSKNLSKIYMNLLKVGKCRASTLLRETGLQRSVVYNALDELVERRLASKFIVKGVSYFSINSPESLVHEAEEKTKLARQVSENLKKIQDVSTREVAVYEGADIIQRVADKSLDSESGSTVYFLGASKFGMQANLEGFWKRFHKKRIEKGIECSILYDKDTQQEIITNRNSLELCQAKYMPFGIDLPMWLVIFEDYISMVVPGDDPPLAFIIKSSKTADGFRNYFKYLWNQSPK